MTGARQFDEEDLLAKALDVFWRKGVTATTMSDVASASGVLRGSLYHAYRDKEQIFLLAFDRYAERFLGAVRAALGDDDLATALDALFDAAIANMTSGKPPRGCLTTKTATDVTNTSATVQARVRRLLDDLATVIRDALADPARAARLAVEPSVAAALIVTFTRGLAVMHCVQPDAKHLRQLARAFARTLIRPAAAARPRRRPRRPA